MKTVRILTTLEAVYEFPDMKDRDLSMVLGQLTPGRTLVLTNVSGAFLSMPARIIRKITVGEEIVWENYLTA